MKKIATLLLCMVILLSGCAGTAKPEDALPAGDVWETIEEAYIYAFPLVLMDATKTSATNTEEPVPGKAPVNQFMHGVALANAQFKNVCKPECGHHLFTGVVRPERGADGLCAAGNGSLLQGAGA